MVVDDAGEAARLVAEGESVVLIVAPDGAPDGAPDSRRHRDAAEPDGPGRLAVFVGPVDDPATRAGAEAMAAELFGRSGETKTSRS